MLKKSTVTQYWASPNKGATNESGFSGLPSGYRLTNGSFHPLAVTGHWWSSTKSDAIRVWYRVLEYSYIDAYRGETNNYGFSVRCLKD